MTTKMTTKTTRTTRTVKPRYVLVTTVHRGVFAGLATQTAIGVARANRAEAVDAYRKAGGK